MGLAVHCVQIAISPINQIGAKTVLAYSRFKVFSINRVYYFTFLGISAGNRVSNS